MKKQHHKTLKFHTIYSIILAIIFVGVIIMVPDITLGAGMIFLFLYVAGNGLIHVRNNQLKRDTMIEYIILSVIALVILIGVIR